MPPPHLYVPVVRSVADWKRDARESHARLHDLHHATGRPCPPTHEQLHALDPAAFRLMTAAMLTLEQLPDMPTVPDEQLRLAGLRRPPGRETMNG